MGGPSSWEPSNLSIAPCQGLEASPDNWIHQPAQKGSVTLLPTLDKAP